MARNSTRTFIYPTILKIHLFIIYIHAHIHVCVCIVPGITVGRRFRLFVLPFFKKGWEGLLLLPNVGEGRKSGAAGSGGERRGAEGSGGEQRGATESDIIDGGRREGAERWFLEGEKREG
ncbi:hypothetical protein ABFS83_04G146100 [Erythranthe nasuta]